MIEDHLYPSWSPDKNLDKWYVRTKSGEDLYVPIPSRFSSIVSLLKTGDANALRYAYDEVAAFQNYLDAYERNWQARVDRNSFVNYVDPVKTSLNLVGSNSAGGGSGGSSIMVPPGNSGASVEVGTSDLADTYGEWTKYLDSIRTFSEAQSAREREAAEAQNAWQRETNQIAMDFNAAEAAKNRDWQEYMSNTAHQREVQDLMAAGLNPVLSASGGNGASVTSGATASGVSSPGAKANVDNTFVLSLLSFLNNIMGYATSTASAGISAGGVLGAARIAAESAEKNTNSSWGLARRLLDNFTQGLLR